MRFCSFEWNRNWYGNNGVSDVKETIYPLSKIFPLAFFTNKTSTFTFPTVREIFNNDIVASNTTPSIGTITLPPQTTSKITIKDSAGNIISTTNSAVLTSSGQYMAEYYISYNHGKYDGCYDTLIYYFSALENKHPLKKYTITDCVIRCLELAEPLRVTNSTGDISLNTVLIKSKEIPRFTFDGVEYSEDGLTYTIRQGSQAEKYDKILAPTFTMTKATLREQLQQIGGFIHAEPRLRNGVIYFDEYGSNKYSEISKKRYISAKTSQNINEYCTSLDSSADNLINRLDYAQGVIIEPFSGGAKTLRCEATTLKIADDETSFISTQLPIMEVVKLEGQALVKGSTTEFTPWIDLTSCVCEQADYLNLSSYDGFFPYTKAYALYYTQGQKNIRGLFYKNPDAISTAWFQHYAIVNCFKLNGYEINEGNDKKITPYPKMRFRVSYIPIFSARIKTNKSIVSLGEMPRTLSYNQSNNFIETRYYGENLKGVIARLGNIEKEYTYKVAFLTDIPKVGELFDENYYISAVSCEYHTTYIKVTVGLSKDFNRLSEYIGISSDIRMWEVSEKQAYSRDTVFNEYVLIDTTNAQQSDNFVLINNGLSIMSAISGETEDIISEAEVLCLNKKGKKVTNYVISLPVVSSAFGNSLLFSFNFEDNYSAGQKVISAESANTKAYLSNYVPYCDFYGRFYYLGFNLKNNTASTVDAFELPQKDNIDNSDAIITTKSKFFVYRKNGADVPTINVQIHFCSTDESIVIGGALASNCALVNQKISKTKLYILPERINKFAQSIDVANLVGYDVPELTGQNIIRFYNGILAQESGKAWAIVTEPQIIKEIVEDEDGNEVEQAIDMGSKLILGRNIDITQGKYIRLPDFVFKQNLYK
jgi:hypothetical protein